MVDTCTERMQTSITTKSTTNTGQWHAKKHTTHMQIHDITMRGITGAGALQDQEHYKLDELLRREMMILRGWLGFGLRLGQGNIHDWLDLGREQWLKAFGDGVRQRGVGL